MNRRRFLQTSLLASLAACAGEATRPEAAVVPTTSSSPADVPAPVEPSPAPMQGDEPTPETTVQPAPEPEPAASPAPTTAALVVLCRDAWGAQPPGDGFVEHRIQRLTVHHSAVVLGDNRRAPARLRQHQRHHQSQGWPDIAYHLGVDRNGNVYDLRPARFAGDTFTNYDPAGHFLVLAEGDFDQEQPTDAQLEGVSQAFAWAAGAFGVAAATLTGHRDHAGTSCPGDAMYARLDDLRARTEELARVGVAREDRCGPEASAYVAAVEAGSA